MSPSISEKKTVRLLAGAQALFQTASVLMATLSGLVGMQLASDKRLATLPVAVMVLAAALMMIPASMLMQRWGRRAGFLTGSGLGLAAGLLGAAGIHWHRFDWFVVAHALFGAYQGFAQYYRFAAADVASPVFKSRAISWVMLGGVVAAIAGPNLARLTQGIGPEPFTASYLVLSVLSVMAGALLTGLRLPAPVAGHVEGSGRPLLQIMRQPVFVTALIGSSVGFGVMIMVMTATPLAMQVCGHPLGDSATVIQWHVLGMFVPSFFTGHLISRFGVLPVMAAGVAALGAHVAIAVTGTAFMHFLSGLVLLGLGWNFLFIGGTSLVTQAYQPAERAKTQAAHDFLMFAVASLASFSAGTLLNVWGWQAVNWTAMPFLGLALLALCWLGLVRRRSYSLAMAST
ncbi:MAG: MFS transporter [Acidobacteriota bacterium]